MKPIANPYPIDTTAKMLEGFIAVDDVLLVWNDAAYNYDWYQYVDDTGTGNPGWMIMDMVAYEMNYLTEETDVVLPAGHGAIFIPAEGGTRVWTVSLQD